MAETTSTRAGIAGFLSALLPGLGQFYNRQWAKGAGFLVGILILDAVLGVSSDAMMILQGSTMTPADPSRLLLRMLPLLGLALWSVADAARVAKRSPA
jgi:hypothetical protein